MNISLDVFIDYSPKTINVIYDWENNFLNLSDMGITSIQDTKFPKCISKLWINRNMLTTLEGVPETITDLDVSHNKLKTTKGLPPNLLRLNMTANKIASLTELPKKIKHLSLAENYIYLLVSFKGEMLLPPNLEFLDISQNSLESSKGLPPHIRTLHISRNRIKKLENLPPNLSRLYITKNEISCLDGIPQNISHLYISQNKLTSLVSPEGVSLLPPTLIGLDASYNQLTTLPLQFPLGLQSLHVYSNEIKNIPSNLPTSLVYLDVSWNRIQTMPLGIVHLRNLRVFDYSNNPIDFDTNIHPAIFRFLCSIGEPIGDNRDTIYNDGQNVHNLTVQNSIRESLNHLTGYTQLVTKSNLSEEEISFLNSIEVHSFFGFTQLEVLAFIENAICGYNDETKEQLYSLLREALHEGKSVCSTGRIGRMVNVLSGFDPNVQIKISDNSQIGAIVSTFKSRNEPKEKVEEELLSRGIEKKDIDTWLEYY